MRRLLPLLACVSILSAQNYDPKYFSDLKWRSIGPYRGGRTVGAAGIADQPNVFFIGVNNGGVWKTDDAGLTWNPIFDDQPTGSIGAIAVAPSNPNILYVGSGEGLQRPDLSVGDGMYKSTDGGKSWRHLGLRDGQQIPAILVDPANPDRLFVAVLGHPYGPNAERGVFRSTDGGQNFQKVLFKDDRTGAIDLAFDPTNPRTVYAVLWQAQQGPWENGAFTGPNSGLFKSTDGGDTWTQLTGGLPTFAQGLGRIGIGVAPSDRNRMYALVEAGGGGGGGRGRGRAAAGDAAGAGRGAPPAATTGLYRSDDAGATWTLVNSEGRISGRGSDFACVRVDPKNKDVIYIANTSTYRSDDAGASFTAIKGAPGGDDYHTVWINPKNPDIILLALDQGATISVNHGRTWSSWYNQPTAQFYHVSTDNQVPYWVYGGQQESGSAGVASRGNDGEITFREWHPVGAAEYAYVAPDPLNSRYVYGGGMGGNTISRWDRVTGEVEHFGPQGQFRHVRTFPVVFSAKDPHVLFVGFQSVVKTADGGKTWDTISPDLSRETYDVPASVTSYGDRAKADATRRGVVYSLGPSPVDVNVLWAGTDDGLIHLTRDGKNWKDVTPPGMKPWSKVAQLDASHFDQRSVYAAVNSLRLDDLKPHIYRTHDDGATWKEIVRGLPDGPINVVREDPVRRGLLFAGSETAVYVSFNDGDDWQPLRLNMPATSIRDLVVKDEDLVVGTHGRGFWILDDITPLREMAADITTGDAHLFAPRPTYRYPRDTNTDTPLPPEEPAGKNPPDGAILYYYLKSAANGPMTLEILDAASKSVAHFSSEDKAPPANPQLNVPTYWLRPFQPLAVAAGMHRFIWDLHASGGGGGRGGGPAISAIYMDTPASEGAWMPAGTYTVKLTVNGQSYSRPLIVKPDPRH